MRTADSGYLIHPPLRYGLVSVAQDVIVREIDCLVTNVNLIALRAQLAEDPLDALELLHDSLLGRVLACDLFIDDQLVLPKDSLLSELALEHIAQHLHSTGVSLTCRPNEVFHLGLASAAQRALCLQAFARGGIGKALAKPVAHLPADHVLTNLDIAALLMSDAAGVALRHNHIRGIDVEAIKEGSSVIESLADRITGRTLAEDIVDSSGALLAKADELIDSTLAVAIAKNRRSVKIRSVLTCKSSSGVVFCFERGARGVAAAARPTGLPRPLYLSLATARPTRRVCRTRRFSSFSLSRLSGTQTQTECHHRGNQRRSGNQRERRE